MKREEKESEKAQGRREYIPEITEMLPFHSEIQHMEPLDRVNGFDVRPGFYTFAGATPIPNGV